MHESWRHFFYYTFGLLPSLFFGLRFFIQWISSEKKKHSHVSRSFWRLSISGNILLALHYFIQMQFLLFLLQIGNGYISWRNLNLLKNKQKISFKASLAIFLGIILISSLIFTAQCELLSVPFRLLEIPAGLLHAQQSTISLLWHLFGAAGCILFASRFWLQWLEAEKTGESRLNKSFWLLSIIGSLAALLYFSRTKDWVSCLNYFFGLIPYVRNLMLLSKSSLQNP